MMDFLDPKKTRDHTIRLLVGYVLLAIAVILMVTILIYQSKGFGVSEGQVIQNGSVYVSSNPGDANIFLNGQKRRETTNSRMILASGIYTMRLEREGYRNWQRTVAVAGGSVDRFDYPLLIPNQLTPSTAGEYPSVPPLVTQSPDRRWLLVQQSAQTASFEVFDVRDPEEVAARKASVSLPSSVLSLPQTGAQSFELAEWSRDNKHLLLQHIVGDQSEYIMMDRENPQQSYNLTQRLQLAQTATVTLQDKKSDRYFIHDTTALTLGTARLDSPTVVPLLTGVVDYKTYGNDVVLYATSTNAAEGMVSVKLYQDEKSYQIRQVAKQTDYLLDVSTYDSHWYVVVGMPVNDNVFVYRDPAQRLQRDSSLPLVPADILKLDDPDYIEFSANSQFVMAENGQNVAVYDAENDRSYNYELDRAIDTPQVHISWMDGYHLSFVSKGQVTILDYDGANVQTLVAGNAAFPPFFDTAYRTLYAVSAAGAQSAENPTTKTIMTATPLRTVRDR